MSHFMLLFRHEAPGYGLSPDEHRTLVREFEAWHRTLKAGGRFVGGGRLTAGEGATLRRVDGRRVIDGPYVETKELLAGFFIVEAATSEEAIALAEHCPILNVGGSVEVRSVRYELVPGLPT